MTDTMTRKLSLPARPERPFEDDGVLLPASGVVLSPEELRARCEGPVAAHLDRVCRWPPAARGQQWQPGDYSFYVLEFPVGPDAPFFVQFWSEPGGEVIMEVSSGEANSALKPFVTEPLRRSLEERGFALGGGAENFRKTLALDEAGGVAGLAHEALSVLTECLGYDGRVPLSYRLHLGRPEEGAESGPVYHESSLIRSLDVDDVEAAWKLARCDAKRLNDVAVAIADQQSASSFVATLIVPRPEHPGRFGGIQLSCYLRAPRETIEAVTSEVGMSLPGARLGVDRDGDLAVLQDIIVMGGVTMENIQLQFALWRNNLARLHAAFLRHAPTGGGQDVVLH